MSTSTFRYYIEHRNTSGTLLRRIEDIVDSMDFNYDRIGGMGEFQLAVNQQIDDAVRFNADDDIRLYVKTIVGSSYELCYRGYVNSYEPKVEGYKDKWLVKGTGYISQLERFIVTHTYESASVETIIKDILDNYVVGEEGSDITYSSPDIENTGLVISQIDFDDTAISAIQKLADICGQREWGVDENAQFFFKQRSNDIREILFIGNDFSSYSVLDDWENIANRIEIRGGRKGDGTIYQFAVNNTQSQTKFGLRARIYNNASIQNDTDANRYGQSILQEVSNVSRRARGELRTYPDWFHRETPIGVIQVPNLDVGFGRTIFNTQLYGVPKYGGIDTFQVNSINYRLAKNGGGFQITLDLGNTRPDLFTPIARLDFGLEQVRAR